MPSRAEGPASRRDRSIHAAYCYRGAVIIPHDVPRKDRATCFSKQNTVLKIKAAESQKSSSETEQFTKIMWVVGCSQSATYECYHSHKWLTNDDHCAKQEMLHHISMRLSSRLELHSVPSNSELELLAGLRIRMADPGMVDPRNGGPPEWGAVTV